MKKGILCLLLVMCLYGCGRENTVIDNEQSLIQEKSTDENNSYSESEQSQEGKVPEKIVLPINSKEETITGEWNGERLAKIFATIGETMYFGQWENDGNESAFYKMKIGQTSLQEVNVNIPEGMNIYAMTNDVYNNLHILLRTKVSSSEDVTSIIRTLDSEGNLVRDLDISKAIEGEISIHQAFQADSKGNFYVTGLWDTIGIDAEGNKMWILENRAIEIGDSYTTILGGDENLYIPYQKDETLYLGKVDTTNGTLMEEYTLLEMDANDRILAMAQGENDEILLYSSASGIWKWNGSNNSLQNTVEMSESELANNEYILIRAFLADGRMLLVKNIDDDKRVYQYIPVQK